MPLHLPEETWEKNFKFLHHSTVTENSPVRFEWWTATPLNAGDKLSVFSPPNAPTFPRGTLFWLLIHWHTYWNVDKSFFPHQIKKFRIGPNSGCRVTSFVSLSLPPYGP